MRRCSRGDRTGATRTSENPLGAKFREVLHRTAHKYVRASEDLGQPQLQGSITGQGAEPYLGAVCTLAGTCGRCTAQSMMPPEGPRRDLRRISLPRGLSTLTNARRRPCSACCLHKASPCGQPLEAPVLVDEGFGTQLRRLYVAGELRTESVQGGSAYRGWTSDERAYELLSRLLHTSACAATVQQPKHTR
jgi:hypothetical protein